MNNKQHTIAKEVSISGVGLHTGVEAKLTFVPAPTNHGIKFQRIDLEGEPIANADVDNVVDTSRGTTIEENGARINTVEHVMAALVGLEIDNILIKIDGPEPPIMDGSSIQFINILKSAGLVEQEAHRKFFDIIEEVRYKDMDSGAEIAALPLNDYRIAVMVDYNSPYLSSQHANLTSVSQFEKEFSMCRTFCFVHEIENLHKAGLIKGGDLNNAIVIANKEYSEEELHNISNLVGKPNVKITKDSGILNNTELHFKNEMARHKLLDLMGDLALVGRPIRGQILASRPGHAANVELAKKIKKQIQESEKNKIPVYDPNQEPICTFERIYELLPHRYPFQMIDKIIYLDDSAVVGIKNVTMNENYFTGHFPNNPVMPGVMQVEAMAQTGGILVLSSVDDPENYWPYLVGIENCRFRRSVLPGDTVIFRCELLAPIRRGIAKMSGKAYVGDKIVCEAEMTASLVRKS
jgi:UDP-3-O-[3-hydroxymyristoyl] N-acetylglucosamine deacetylase/3-hydroxyacyl-[acyl-carrier-protein] dehydratase